MEEYKDHEFLTSEQIESISLEYIEDLGHFFYNGGIHETVVINFTRDIENAIAKKLKSNGYKIVKG